MKNKTLDSVIKNTWQAIARMYNEEASQYGASMALGYALLNIDKEGTPSTALAPRLGMEPTSLTRTLKTMEEKGLIIKKKNPKDGRGVNIYLTPLGVEKRGLSKQTVINFNNKLLETFSQQEIDNFIEMSEKIQNIIIEKKKF
ncbi:MarR family transcriptional regulator [Flavobacterium sp. CBA20B-1]|uniref:MarR family winged helix-turn-helix transcriptional regulator n=1 Tax=unclassified Flavobacterium TaxID=196869 RepID=UPI0022251470|nr:MULTISPECIES: MarR family transcriptional regulator [unclassified Flavobacterium]WCM42172.1 MarR family transcriptional regulator [Flavobacterium sp. CBA20B-1]